MGSHQPRQRLGRRTVGRVNRGDIWEHPLRGRRFAIVSTDHLNDTGTVIVAEIVPDAPHGTRGMLAVTLNDNDPCAGTVIAYRINWQATERMADWKYIGRLSAQTTDIINMALRTAMDL
jgi:mRNA-degrading endonuclease toxin of MazEF toxin-antitoxin module